MVVGSVVVGIVVAYLIFANVIQHMAKNKETAIVAIDSSEFEAPPPPKNILWDKCGFHDGGRGRY